MTTSIELSSEDTFDLLFDNKKVKIENNMDRKVFVDVGAYNGDTIERALSINPNLRVIAIEPIGYLCGQMKLKFKDNKNISIINKACYNMKSEIIFNEYNGWSNGLSTINFVMTQLRPKSLFTTKINNYPILADTLDNILSANNIDKIDYLKVDVESAEEPVLEGFTKYHEGTRFHVESHIINLENILFRLLEMNANIEKVTLFRDGNIKNHILGTIVGEF